MIKLLSILVALVASVLLYRVIFFQNAAVAETNTGDINDINKKLNDQKVEIDALKVEGETAKVELEKQRTEVYNLRQTIKEKETEVEAVKAENAQLKNQTEESRKADYEKHKSEVILSTSDESLLFQKEIAELKRRLSDYEIIAEDISDMQRLKEENEKLKAQVAQAGLPAVGTEPTAAQAPDTTDTPKVESAPAAAPAAAAASQPSEPPTESPKDELGGLSLESLAEVTAAMTTNSEASTEPFRNPSENAPSDFVPNEKSSIETEVLGPGPGDESNVENIDQILSEAAKKSDQVEPIAKKIEPSKVIPSSSSDDVSDVDKSLLEKFEKQKGS